MGNSKHYTFRLPIKDEDQLTPDGIHALRDALQVRARTSEVVVGDVATYGERHLLGCLYSSSQVANMFVDFLRERFPNRWLVVFRYDEDWSDFRVIRYEPDGLVGCVVADNWREVAP